MTEDKLFRRILVLPVEGRMTGEQRDERIERLCQLHYNARIDWLEEHGPSVLVQLGVPRWEDGDEDVPWKRAERTAMRKLMDELEKGEQK